jgi:hypothetical protein
MIAIALALCLAPAALATGVQEQLELAAQPFTIGDAYVEVALPENATAMGIPLLNGGGRRLLQGECWRWIDGWTPFCTRLDSVRHALPRDLPQTAVKCVGSSAVRSQRCSLSDAPAASDAGW